LDKRRIFALGDDDVERILSVDNVEVERLKRTPRRNRLIIRLLIVTGLRVAELASIRIEDIDFTNRMIHVWHGKGRKQRVVLVEPETLQALREFCRDRKAEDLLIGLKPRQIQNVVKRYAVAAGVKWAAHVSPHRLRDTFAVYWVRHGGDLESLRRLLGHNSLATTQRYLVFDFDEVRTKYDKIFQEKT